MQLLVWVHWHCGWKKGGRCGVVRRVLQLLLILLLTLLCLLLLRHVMRKCLLLR